MRTKTFVFAAVPFPSLPALSATAPPGLAAQSVLVEAKTTAGDEVATIRSDSMRLLVPLHLLTGGLEAGYVAVGDSLRVRGEGSFLATGTYDYNTTVPPPASGSGGRMMWYPQKAAFRAGYVSGTQWDAASVGVFSTAFGYTTTASGNASTALGQNTAALGDFATAFGFNTTAGAGYSTALGSFTVANGLYSTALGLNTTAQAYASLVMGRYNVVEGSITLWQASDPLFVVGNGNTDLARSNALTLYKNGNLTIAGTLTQSSDARLKEGIEPLEGTLERVLQLTPIRYRFRAGTGRPQGTQIGLTAQQVAPLFPDLVKRDGDGYLSLSYANLSAVLVRAVQEQEAEMGTLQGEVRALQTENERLRARHQSMEAELASLRRHNERLESELGSLRTSRDAAEARVARLERLVEQLLSTRSTAPAPTLPDAPR